MSTVAINTYPVRYGTTTVDGVRIFLIPVIEIPVSLIGTFAFERNTRAGMSPAEAAHRTMDEVGGAHSVRVEDGWRRGRTRRQGASLQRDLRTFRPDLPLWRDNLKLQAVRSCFVSALSIPHGTRTKGRHSMRSRSLPTSSVGGSVRPTHFQICLAYTRARECERALGLQAHRVA